jgi:uncharacterized membrane protein
MTVDFSTLFAILAMAAATILTRTSGLYLMNLLTLDDRQKKVLDAIPPAVLMAVIAPVALATGSAETIAAALTVLAALRLPLLASTAIGVAAVAIMRATGFA